MLLRYRSQEKESTPERIVVGVLVEEFLAEASLAGTLEVVVEAASGSPQVVVVVGNLAVAWEVAHSCCIPAGEAFAKTAGPGVLEVASIVVEEVVDTGLDDLRTVAGPNFDLQEVVAEGIRIAVVGRREGGSSLTLFTREDVVVLRRL